MCRHATDRCVLHATEPVSEINISLPIFCFITGAKRRARGSPSCNNVTLITSAPRWGHPLQEQCLAAWLSGIHSLVLSVCVSAFLIFVRSFFSVLSSCLECLPICVSVFLLILVHGVRTQKTAMEIFTVVGTSFSCNPSFLCRCWSSWLYCLNLQG